MKKFEKIISIALAALMICTVFTSCSSMLADLSKNPAETVTEGEYTTAAPEPTLSTEIDVDDDDDDYDTDEDEGLSDSGKTNAFLKIMLNTDTFKKQLKQAKSLFGNILKMKAYAEGSTLVYKYTYRKHMTDSQIKTLKKSLTGSSIKKSAKNIVKTMVNAGYDDIKVSYRYFTKEGKLIKKFDYDKSDI